MNEMTLSLVVQDADMHLESDDGAFKPSDKDRVN